MGNQLYGLYRAVVRNNIDPAHRYRLQIDAADLGADSLTWAEACVSCTPICSPDIGTSVWIMFEAGDVAYPVWVGVRPEHTT